MLNFTLRQAEPRDVPAICGLIMELAVFENLAHLVEATPEKLMPQLFGQRPAAEAMVAVVNLRPLAAQTNPPPPHEGVGQLGCDPALTHEVVAFALYFSNFSTFLAKPGLYLEDLYVKPERRGAGIGKAMLRHLAALALQRGCGRFEWSVLDWNANAIRFYEGMGATVMPEWQICRVTGLALAQLGAVAAD